jgi:hypothetical protein
MRTRDIRGRVADVNPVPTPTPGQVTPAQERLLAELLATPRTGARPRRLRRAVRLAFAAAVTVASLAATYAVVVLHAPGPSDEVEVQAPSSSRSLDTHARRWTGERAPRSVQRAFQRRDRLPDGSTDPSVDMRPLPPMVLVGAVGRYREYATRSPDGFWCSASVELFAAGPRITGSSCGDKASMPADDEVQMLTVGDYFAGRVVNEQARTVTFDAKGLYRPVTTPVGRYGFFIAELPPPVAAYYMDPDGDPSAIVVARDAKGRIVARAVG